MMKSFLIHSGLLLFILFATNSYAETVEVVVFSAKDGVSDASVLESSEGMLETMKKWGGFISRELIKVGNGKWIDIVHWSDPESAESAQHKAMESDSCLLFFSLLEGAGQQIYYGDKVLVQAR